MNAARADIEATGDLLERALKLSGLITELFRERGFPLMVVGGSAVEFYETSGIEEEHWQWRNVSRLF